MNYNITFLCKYIKQIHHIVVILQMGWTNESLTIKKFVQSAKKNYLCNKNNDILI